MFRSVVQISHELIHHPVRVFWICVALASTAVFLDGTALRLWSLHREYHMIEKRIADAKTRSKQLEFRIQEAQQPEFIEKAARDQFDLVKEGDLVFVFADESAESSVKTTD
jgi:cell division protein FtsB